jgi:ATP-dependent DNA helicase DinG
MRRHFDAAGTLSRGLPGFEPRAEQLALATAVERALGSGEHLLAEAGTGTGKSLAYLVPALESGLRVVVATATKALQEQLLVHDVPAAAVALGRDVDAAILKGRENYLCRRNLDGLEVLGSQARLLIPDGDAGDELERLWPWIESTATGDRAELDFEPRPALWAELAVGADRCRGPRCPFAGSCFSEAARARAAKAELVVTNHALYLADVALRARLGADGPLVLPEHDAVVFDEAHRLEDGAAAWLGGRVSLAGVRRLLRDVERAHRDAARVPPAPLLERADRAADRAIGPLETRRGRRRLRELELVRAAPGLERLAQVLETLAEALTGRSDELDALAGRAHGVAGDVLRVLAWDDVDRVAWAEPGSLAWAPVDVAPLLREVLWESGVTAVLVSATLEPAFARARLGLDGARELVLDSPYDYAAQALLYVPERMPEPRAPGYEQRVVEEVAALCRASRGRALVLTTSFAALDAIAAGLAEAVSYPVLRQGDAPRERLLARFRAEVDTVLVATQTFWQGVDVPGESLSLVVIDKLPFQVPGDPLVEARCERLAADGVEPFLGYQLPAAVLALRQGFGRLIRGHGDRGAVAILDGRVRTRAYGEAFLSALPRCPRVGTIDEVAAFFAEAAVISTPG